MDIKKIVDIAYDMADQANIKYLEKLDKDEEQVMCLAFEKRFKELNKEK